MALLEATTKSFIAGGENELGGTEDEAAVEGVVVLVVALAVAGPGLECGVDTAMNVLMRDA